MGLGHDDPRIAQWSPKRKIEEVSFTGGTLLWPMAKFWKMKKHRGAIQLLLIFKKNKLTKGRLEIDIALIVVENKCPLTLASFRNSWNLRQLIDFALLSAAQNCASDFTMKALAFYSKQGKQQSHLNNYSVHAGNLVALTIWTIH